MFDPYNRIYQENENNFYPVGVPVGIPYQDPESSFAAAQQNNDVE